MSPATVHLFCRVIDNFGDIGVCWRLARQFHAEYGLEVTLWVDDLASFQRICRAVQTDVEGQTVKGVVVRRWTAAFPSLAPEEVADVVIEAFACDLPSEYVAAMARRSAPPAWINLEYLSAEGWVEGCHAMPSQHPFLSLTKHFFFPGFTGRTGGLPFESALSRERELFQADSVAINAFWQRLGVAVPEHARCMSLFCYPTAPVAALFQAMQQSAQPVLLVVPEGVACDVVGDFLGMSAVAGARSARGNLHVQVLPFIDQQDYDRLLWACDLNFVRGEDSFVRAQWAARPFVWHIYPQPEEAHVVKLSAFLSLYCSNLCRREADAVTRMWHAWNGDGQLAPAWQTFSGSLFDLTMHAENWSVQLRSHGDLAANLIQFAREIS